MSNTDSSSRRLGQKQKGLVCLKTTRLQLVADSIIMIGMIGCLLARSYFPCAFAFDSYTLRYQTFTQHFLEVWL